jgi:hypothetical protein
MPALLHGELESEAGKKVKKTGRRKIWSNLSDGYVDIDCELDNMGYGQCKVLDHDTGEVLKEMNIVPKGIFAGGVGKDRR